MTTERRRALAFLSEQQIAQVLALPEGARVIGVRDDFQRMGVLVMLEGDAYEPVSEACEPPRVPAVLLAPPDEALRASVSGFCVDFGCNVTVGCPAGCIWVHVWEGDIPSIGDVLDVVRRHLGEVHA